MNTQVAYDIENENGIKLVTEVDETPIIWNFLLGLDRNDLIAELVQNDLDQDATRTVISFEQDRLVCEGNGKPVDPKGWQRLRKMQGAGDSVPAKRGKIGIKNHGLKTAFAIGDELRLSSAGRSIIQTLYADGRDEAPRPGASPAPQPDPQAPVEGCRIVIRYRNVNIQPPAGEAIVIQAVSKQETDTLFKSVCANIPEQFAGIVSPEVVSRYEITLRHWHLGEARFVFSCTRPQKAAKGIEIFRRRCAVSGDAQPLPDDQRETAVRRLLPLKGQLKQRVADFYRHRNRFFVEVSWPVDGRGKPSKGAGRFRYPIGYPKSSHEALTGHGAFFNAPFVSDTDRHGPAWNEATNKGLRGACEALLVDALARHAILRWGPDGLNPLVPSPESDNEDEAVRPLLAALVTRDALPTLKWQEAAGRVLKHKRQQTSSSARREAIQRRPGELQKYRFVVPVTTWEPNLINPPLSVICPRAEKQLDPRVHADIVRLLADGKTDGFCEAFITFEEDDALSRATGEGNQYFAACDNPEREFAQSLIVRSYLDVIEESLEHDKCDAERQDTLREALLLPDSHAKVARFQDMHASAPLPSDVPGLRLPPILHRDLALHPLFGRKKWRRPKYTMAKFLESEALKEADERTRKQFWKWLRQNEGSIGARERAKLTDIAIWPDADGRFCKLSNLCDPRSRRVAIILGDLIRRPHKHVRQSRIATSGKKRRTSIRRVPLHDEISGWLERRRAPFVPGDMPDEDTITALKCFEADLAILLKDPGIARVLRGIEIALPALAQDGSIRLRAELVMPSTNIGRLALRGRFLLKKNRHTSLDKLSKALSEPKVTMLLSTFDEDRENFGALQARLRQFLALTKPSDSHRGQLAGMPILPVSGQPRTPQELAFMGSKGDYWGAWKTRISAKDLSQDDQRRYRGAGVISASPIRETSRAFFVWLSQQDAAVLEQHVNCVLRHILHRDRSASWAEVFTDTPFIPAKAYCGLRLVSLRDARNGPVYLPDIKEITDAVIANDPRVALVIDRVQGVNKPISEPLRGLGIRSLREAIGEPKRVVGSGNIQQAPERFLDRLTDLRSQPFRRTVLKRLNELGVESELVRRDWHDRLSRIGEIRCADNVEARYRFRRKPYPISVNAGFDPESGTFWIKRGPGSGLSNLFEAVAGQLIFKTNARMRDLMTLERALTLEISDPIFGRSTSKTPSSEDEGGASREGGPYGEDAEDIDFGSGEAVLGHSPLKPDPTRNIPKSRPIPSGSISALLRGGRRSNGSGSSKDGDGNKPAPEIEKEHIEALKRDQYASHCQMCLCKRPPRELAPGGSYIEWEEVRRRVVEAHHVDLKSAGGARHAGNLILLCKCHHDNYGRRLTRVAVTDALRCEKKDKVIHFGEGSNARSDVKGLSVKIVIPDTGESVELFFTKNHSDYWLSRAG